MSEKQPEQVNDDRKNLLNELFQLKVGLGELALKQKLYMKRMLIINDILLGYEEEDKKRAKEEADGK